MNSGTQRASSAEAQDLTENRGRQRLIQAAAGEFAGSGFAGASIAAIAARAGVSKSTVFHHFSSKQDLYMAVIGDAAAEFGQRLGTVLSHAEDPAKVIEAFQLEHLNHIQRNEQVATLVLREMQEADSERAVSLVRNVLSPNFSRLVDYLNGAAEAGLIRTNLDGHAAALTLMAANVIYFQNRQMFRHLPGFELADDPGAYAKAVANVVFYGLENRGNDS
jgi:TetR/AcrR family transcriptional regulator